ncbi:hypothetical protein GCM10007092_15050 [Thermus composti]|uniref:HEAT repeat domain-containing protein n=1 Tax=Thermus composti TaxID=532059 RepID=A0ABV6PZV4_9DEIN|nr:HEAT repeat domain-containing protein [Thermus composti]GGN01825.1 hypothetical protein GCM10007092_15050 [Thermus composti]
MHRIEGQWVSASFEQTFLSGFRPALEASLARELARIAREDPSAAVRRRAIEALKLAQPGPWREGVEGTLREALGDPDPEVRRAVAEHFAAVPAREVATTAGRWGFASVRWLVEELWEEPETLRRVAGYFRQQEFRGQLGALTGNPGSPYLPTPSVEDLPWVAATLARIEPGARDPRLAPLVELLNL